MPNLFIAYDLDKPGQNYDGVRDAIKSLGKWHQFQFSLFYIHTIFSTADAYNRVVAMMDINDRLAVIDASGTWTNPNPLGGNGLPAEGGGHLDPEAKRLHLRIVVGGAGT
jgi:hypothetical protein